MAKAAIFGGTRGTVSHYSGPHRIHIDRGRIWEDMPPDASFLHGGDEQGRMRHFGPDFSLVRCADVTSTGQIIAVGQYRGFTTLTATGTPGVTSRNGVLAMLTGTATNDNYDILFNGGIALGTATASVPFTPVANTTIRFGAEIKINTLATSQVVVGLRSDASYTLASETANFIAIRLNNGSASLRREKASSGTPDATTLLAPDGSANVTADTYAEVGFVIRGVTAMEGYHDGQRTEVSDVDHLPIVGMYPFFYVENDATDSSTRTASIRRWTITQEVI